MRIALLISFLLPLTITLNAQCYSKAVIPYNPATLTGTPVVLGNNEFSPMIPIGFDFCFYGAVYDSLTIFSNGLVSFLPIYAGGTFNIWSQPTALLPNPYSMPSVKMCIMMPWQNLNPSIGGTVTWSVAGTAPFRSFNISYVNVPMDSCSFTFTGQIRIFESTYVIETHILNRDTCAAQGDRGIHGLHDYGYINDIVPGRNFGDSWVTSNEGMRFTPICNVCSGVGLAESSNHNSYSVYPNPGKSSVLISFENETASPAKISIVDAMGREIRCYTNVTSEFIEIKREGLAEGIYVFTITRDGAPTLTGKFIFTDE